MEQIEKIRKLRIPLRRAITIAISALKEVLDSPDPNEELVEIKLAILKEKKGLLMIGIMLYCHCCLNPSLISLL